MRPAELVPGGSIRMFLDASGRMHAASAVVRCPLTPHDSEPLRSSRARPTAWDGITPERGRLPGSVALPPQE